MQQVKGKVVTPKPYAVFTAAHSAIEDHRDAEIEVTARHDSRRAEVLGRANAFEVVYHPKRQPKTTIIAGRADALALYLALGEALAWDGESDEGSG